MASLSFLFLFILTLVSIQFCQSYPLVSTLNNQTIRSGGFIHAMLAFNNFTGISNGVEVSGSVELLNIDNNYDDPVSNATTPSFSLLSFSEGRSFRVCCSGSIDYRPNNSILLFDIDRRVRWRQKLGWEKLQSGNTKQLDVGMNIMLIV